VKPPVIVSRPKVWDDPGSSTTPDPVPTPDHASKVESDDKRREREVISGDPEASHIDRRHVKDHGDQRPEEVSRVQTVPPNTARSVLVEIKPPEVRTPEKQDIVPAPPPQAKSSTASMSDKDLPKKKWAGNWLYVPKSSETKKFQYEAEYVELTLAEQDGNLNGTYWSRYRIPDQAIASEVRLRLNGKSTDANTLDLHWVSVDGAEGESQLILEGPDIMSFNWWTVHSGPRPGLSSGGARVIRQRRP
jgi:hypothetical protein